MFAKLDPRLLWLEQAYVAPMSLPGGATADYYRRGTGEPLVVVPGLAGGVALLQPLLERLSHQYEVTAIELRGERDAWFDRAYDLDTLADDLDYALRSLRLERPNLLGVSFGGAVALRYALRHPRQLGSLTLQGTGSCFVPSLFTRAARAVLDRMPLPTDSPFVNQFFRILVGGAPPNVCGEDEFRYIVEHCWATDQSVMSHRLAVLDGFDVEDELPRLQVPTLVLAGKCDAVVPAAAMRNLARRLPRASLCRLDSAGHFAFVTHPDLVVERMNRFARATTVEV